MESHCYIHSLAAMIMETHLFYQWVSVGIPLPRDCPLAIRQQQFVHNKSEKIHGLIMCLHHLGWVCTWLWATLGVPFRHLYGFGRLLGCLLDPFWNLMGGLWDHGGVILHPIGHPLYMLGEVS